MARLSSPLQGEGSRGSRRSIRLDRQCFVPRPLSHRPVVERQPVVAQLVQQEQVDGGGDAAAAIADHVPILRHPARIELRLGVAKRRERLGRGVDEARGRHVDAAGDAARSAVILPFSKITCPLTST